MKKISQIVNQRASLQNLCNAGLEHGILQKTITTKQTSQKKNTRKKNTKTRTAPYGKHSVAFCYLWPIVFRKRFFREIHTPTQPFEPDFVDATQHGPSRSFFYLFIYFFWFSIFRLSAHRRRRASPGRTVLSPGNTNTHTARIQSGLLVSMVNLRFRALDSSASFFVSFRFVLFCFVLFWFMVNLVSRCYFYCWSLLRQVWRTQKTT